MRLEKAKISFIQFLKYGGGSGTPALMLSLDEMQGAILLLAAESLTPSIEPHLGLMVVFAPETM